ncbi:hypothetical protein V757_07565 [Pelistega indica]|uniref:YbaK/aminoacyl-tRNA synthetase-associated domain-containing protein n=1 Tax=Pelistega indica TaxID=1414851 RepID=V8G3B2_9BURK|nr:YbaK/prolyl-tRNA synthetase associated domain-containing protein [Pelistega indica]ETD70576.1 hypothetical protein V757_07565 [Pelistega indica]
MSEHTYQQLISLLEQQHASFQALEHPSAGKSEEVAKIRGTEVGQGAKALVCKIKGNGIKQYVLAVLPADQQANLQKVALALGGTRASLASPDEVTRLTDCVFGAIPPFSFHPELMLVADPSLLQRYPELAFNAGTLEKSIVLKTADYAKIAQPKLIEFIN